MGAGSRGMRGFTAVALLTGIVSSAPAASAPTAADSPSAYMANRLVDFARECSRQMEAPPAVVARATGILLQAADKLHPGDVYTLKLLAEAAHAAGRKDVEKDALRKIIGVDPGDLVAQVEFLDVLAGDTESLDERSKIYQAALQKKELNDQIRSEMAVRLGQVALNRGDEQGATVFFKQALQLNDVNVAALRELVRLSSHEPAERMGALFALLRANPYQPEAWLDAARVLESTNLHAQAAEFLNTALEQMQLRGTPIPGELYQEFGVELSLAGQNREAGQIFDSLAKLADAPLSTLIAARLAGNVAVATKPANGPATEPAAGIELSAKLDQQLAALAKEGTPAALADAAGTQLTVMPTLGGDTENWVKSYAALVTGDDVTLGRLHGWLEYRQGKLDEAAKQFESLKNFDPLSKLGLVRVLIDQGKKDVATRTLQELWSAHPSGTLAMQINRTARQAEITLSDTPLMQQMRNVLSKLPAGLSSAHRQPSDLTLLDATFRKFSAGVGEPVLLSIRITNVSDHALSVGAVGAVQATVGLSAIVHVDKPTPLGLYAIENLQRTFRLEPRAVIESTLRADQGALATLFDQHPNVTFQVDLRVMTAPHKTPGMARDSAPGLGGQESAAGDFQRTGAAATSQAELIQLTTELGTLTGEKQLTRIETAAAMLGSLMNGPAVDPANNLTGQVKVQLMLALRPLFDSPDALVRAELARSLPAMSLGTDMDQALARLATDPDSTVRLLWAGNQIVLANRPGEAGRQAMAVLQQRATAETDPLVKEWMTLLATYVKPGPPTSPATAPGN